MKFRQHHNNKGKQQIKSGNVRRQLIKIARKLNIPYSGKIKTRKVHEYFEGVDHEKWETVDGELRLKEEYRR